MTPVLRAPLLPAAAGAVCIALAVQVAPLAGIALGVSGVNAWNFRIALTLNGIGWNFLFVGATTVVGGGVYKTRTEAETAMKTVKVCTSN